MGPVARTRGLAITAAAFFLVLAVTLYLARREPEGQSRRRAGLVAPGDTPPAQAAPSRPEAPTPSAATLLRERPQGTGRYVRLKRTDGIYEIVEETAELAQRLDGRISDAHAKFLAAQEEFEGRFERLLAKEGPVAAWALLTPRLRAPQTENNEDAAQVYAALRLVAKIQSDLGRAAVRPSLYEPIRAPVTAALISFLADPRGDAAARSVALGYLAGLSMNVSVAGPAITEGDGLPAYDPEGPVTVTVSPAWPAVAELRDIARGNNPALQDPDVAKACLLIARDPSEPQWLRADALRSLGTRTELLDKLDLGALAADADEDVSHAAVDLLGLRPNALPPGAFFTLLDSREDPEWKRRVFERLSRPSFDDPRMTAVLNRSLPNQPAREPEDASEGYYRTTVLQIALRQYAERKGTPILDLLSGRLSGWAPFEWPESGSPVVAVADFAARHGLKEFASPLRSVISSLASPADAERVRAALTRLDP